MKINPMIAQQYPLQLNEEKIAHLLREFLSETNRKYPRISCDKSQLRRKKLIQFEYYFY